jgi:hypothetical protein
VKSFLLTPHSKAESSSRKKFYDDQEGDEEFNILPGLFGTV